MKKLMTKPVKFNFINKKAYKLDLKIRLWTERQSQLNLGRITYYLHSTILINGSGFFSENKIIKFCIIKRVISCCWFD